MKKIFTLLLISFVIQANAQEFTYKEKKELKAFPDYIMQAGFSPFRNYFAIAIGNNTIEIYDKDWNKIFTHQGNSQSAGGHFSFSPDEKYLAYAKYKSDNDIAIIRLEDRKVIQVLNGHSYYINKLEYSHNGKLLASASSDKSMCVWKWNNEKMELSQKFVHDESVNGASFNYNDEYLISVGNDRKITTYKYVNGKFLLADSIVGLKYRLDDVSFHPFKNEFVVSSNYELRRYNLEKQKLVFTDSIKISVNGTVEYNSTGDYLVFGKYNDLVILKVNSNEIIEFERIFRHGANVFGGTFSDDGLFLTSFSSDQSVIIWELTGVNPSRKSLVVDYMDRELTSVQKIILTSEVIENILNSLDKKLTAPRDEFETSIQYSDRREILKSEVLAQLQYFTEKHFNINSKQGGKVQIPIERIVGYNADLQIYKIRFLETDAGVKIPVNEAKTFKKNWEKAYLQANKIKSKNNISFEYTNFELVLPNNNKTFEVTPLENPFHKVKNNRSIGEGKERSESNIPKSENKAVREDTRGTDRAIIFATNIYDSFSELVNPVIDATTIAEELQSNYFVQTEVIINPTLKEAIEKIREYAKMEYSPNDNLLIFFAGHGIYDEVFKEGYVISRDSKSDDVAKTSYLSHSNLRTMINNIPCNHVLLVMDVCFGGTFDPLVASKSRAADMYTEVTNEEFIQRKMKYKTRLYLTSGGKEYVPDGRPGHHSPFARKFLEAMRNYGGNDGILTMNEIIQYVEKVEPQPRFGEFGDNEPGSDFILLVK
ncbi:MAG: caspase family protein [Bacteroidales bacterium]|jgi:hypothetical protein|nr:caspase family protein [Bacteroidales bacterium]